jgi:hypothetical protein
MKEGMMKRKIDLAILGAFVVMTLLMIRIGVGL